MKQKNVQLEALIDSKKEYMDHLFDLLTEPMVMMFQDMYQECLQAPETRKKGILATFQDALTGIVSWNNHLIQEHYNKIVAHTGCKYVPDLVRALINVQVKINLIANTKAALGHNIKLKVPSAENFVHRCYIDVARAIWKRPYLLYHNVRSVEKQQNLLDLEKLMQHSIRTTLRGFVPMDQLIAQMNMNSVDEASSSPDSSSTSESESEDDDTYDEESSDTESSTDESIVEVVELPEELQNEVVPSDTEEELQNEVIVPSDAHTQEELQNEVNNDDVENEVQDEDLGNEELKNEVNNEVNNEVENAVDIDDETDNDAFDITVIHEEPLKNVAPSNDVMPALLANDYQEADKKNVELTVVEEDPDSPELHVNKVADSEPTEPVVMSVVGPTDMEDRAAPFNMMIMNRKIITHRPPTTMVIKKKKKDAFF